MSDPNSFDQELKDSQKPNPEVLDKGTEDQGKDPNPAIDYKKKFSESSAEALRLLEEGKLKDAEIERLKASGSPEVEIPKDKVTEVLYPGFEELDEEAKQNLIRYTDMVTKRATAEINKDPAIAFARHTFNERKFDMALDSVIKDFPELKESRDELKVKYFNASNVPNNIESILKDISKIHLFDKAKEIGAKEEKTKVDRIDLERSTGGDKTPKTSRALSDWQRMAQENPAKFASMSKQYNEDLASGKI